MQTPELEKHVFVTDTDVKRLLLLVEDLSPGEVTIDNITIKSLRQLPWSTDYRTYETIEFHGNGGLIELNIAWYPNSEGGKEIERVQIKMGEKYLHAMPKFVSTENQLPLDVYNTLKDTLEKCRKHHHLNDVDIKQQMESTGNRARKILGIPES